METVDLYALIQQYPPSSPAWSLMDAFDAATNGMENPESFMLMETITETTSASCGHMAALKSNGEQSSLRESCSLTALLPWVFLVRAIKALYTDDINACAAALESIPESTAPAALKGLFRAFIAGRKKQNHHNPSRFQNPVSFGPAKVAVPKSDILEATSGCMPHPLNVNGIAGLPETSFQEVSLQEEVRKFYHKLLVAPHPLSLLAEQAEEALRQGLEDQFCLFACRLLRGLREQRGADGAQLALRYAQYGFSLLEEAAFKRENFFSQMIRILGEADSFLALAFYLLDKDDGAAAEALSKALAAGDGVFLDRTMKPLVMEIAAALGKKGAKRGWPETPKYKQGELFAAL